MGCCCSKTDAPKELKQPLLSLNGPGVRYDTQAESQDVSTDGETENGTVVFNGMSPAASPEVGEQVDEAQAEEGDSYTIASTLLCLHTISVAVDAATLIVCRHNSVEAIV